MNREVKRIAGLSTFPGGAHPQNQAQAGTSAKDPFTFYELTTELGF